MDRKRRVRVLVFAVAAIMILVGGFAARHYVQKLAANRLLADLVKMEDEEGVLWALAAGADPNTMLSLEGLDHTFSILHFAVQDDDLTLARILIKRGADLNIKDSEDWRPLHDAIMVRNLAACKLLIESGADVNAPCVEGRTPLHNAAVAGLSDLVKLMLAHGGDLELKDVFSKRTTLAFAAEGGHKDLVKELISRGANVKGSRGLTFAASGGYADIVQILLTAGADPNEKQKGISAPPYMAASGGHPQCLKLLIDAGGDVTARGRHENTAFHQAASDGHVECVKLLLAAGVDVDIRGGREWTALHLATACLAEESVRDLLDAGADVNARDDEGETPLHKLADRGDCRLESLRAIGTLLIQHGADVNAVNTRGWTPLDIEECRKPPLGPLLAKHGGKRSQELRKESGVLVQSVSFNCSDVPPVFEIPEKLKDREKLFRAGLKYMPEGLLVTGATLIGGQEFRLNTKENQSLTNHLNEAYAAIAKDPELAGMPSALPYCFSTKKHKKGHYFLYVPKEIPRPPKCIVFLHGYGGNFQFYTWAMKQAFPNAVIIIPSWGASWHTGSDRYLKKAIADAEMRLQVGLPERWLFAISGGGDAGFRIYGEDPKAFKGYVCVASAPRTKTIGELPKRLNIMTISGTRDEGFPILYVRKQVDRLKDRGITVRAEELISDHFFLLSKRKETIRLMREFVKSDSK